MQPWYDPEEMNGVNAQSLQATPAASDTLLSHCRQELAGGFPVALYTARTHRIGAAIRGRVAPPAPTQQECAIHKLFEREKPSNGTNHRLEFLSLCVRTENNARSAS